MNSGEADSALKCYRLENGERSGWAVSGPSGEKGRRWRRVFATREEAEAFVDVEIARQRPVISEVSTSRQRGSGIHLRAAASADPVGSDFESETDEDDRGEDSLEENQTTKSRHRTRVRQRRRRSWAYWLKRVGPVVLVVAVAFATERTVRRWFGESLQGKLLSSDFEKNPLQSHWINSGLGAEWTNAEHCSGQFALAIRDAAWSSPMLPAKPLQWYSLKFKSKAPGTVANPGSVTYGSCSVSFYSKAGHRLSAESVSSVFQSKKWQANDLRIRAHALADAAGNLVPASMRITFTPIGSQPFFVDDVVIEETTPVEVAEWTERNYKTLPANLDYQPKKTRWQRIPLTMQKLRQGQKVRIVFLGDELQQDLANYPLDARLHGLYPGPRLEIISSAKPETGVAYFKEHLDEYVIRWVPDLVIIGGASNGDDMASFQQVVDQINESDATMGRKTEIMLVTPAWSASSVPPDSFDFAAEMRELDQRMENDATVPDDYRGRLLAFAAANGIEFLDLAGIASEFIFGPAMKAAVGPPTGGNGEPYSFWMRDGAHPNNAARLVMGRILEAYFTASPGQNGKAMGGEKRE